MGTRLYAQTDERNINPVIDYSRTPQQYTIGNITVDGVKSYDDYILIGLSRTFQRAEDYVAWRGNHQCHQTLLEEWSV